MKYFITLFFLLTVTICKGGSLTIENDVFASTDMAYTHGTRFIYDSSIEDNTLEFLYRGRERSLSYVVAQYMYTPADILTAELIINDRPYGGWLYVGIILQAYTDFMLDVWEVDLGITGPKALSGDTQRLIHDWIDSKEPMGWDNQIKEEGGVNISWHRKFRYKPVTFIHVIPNFGGCLGNIYTFANLGVMLRLGYNLPDDFGPLLMEPSNRNLNKFGFYLFTQFDSRYVARNIFLDGNTFKDSHSVPKENLVNDLTLGASLTYNTFEFIYAHTIRTKEHKFQDGNQEFGTLMFSWKY